MGNFESGCLSDLMRLDAWSRLTAPVSGLCYEVAHRLRVPTDRIFNPAANYLGFSGHEGFLRGLQQAARAHLVCNRILAGARMCPSDDYEFVEALSEKLRANDIRALEMPYKPKVRITDVEVEDDEVTRVICVEVSRFLEDLRSDILYGFTSKHNILSPQAVNHARALAVALAEDSGPGATPLDEAQVWRAIAGLRFNGTGIADWVSASEDDNTTPEWAKLNRAPDGEAVLDVTRKLRDTHQGYVPNAALRKALTLRPSVGNDVALEQGPPIYLAMAYAPDHARFNIAIENDWPAVSNEIYVRTFNDITDVLLGSIVFPRGVATVSSAEAEFSAAPSLAGWLKLYWDGPKDA